MLDPRPRLLAIQHKSRWESWSASGAWSREVSFSGVGCHGPEGRQPTWLEDHSSGDPDEETEYTRVS